MRKLIAAAVSTLSLLALLLAPSLSRADLCFNCASGSSCQQCRARGGSDTQAARQACEKMGCKITGTGSCSTAANVKVCRAPSDAPWAAAQPQCFLR